MKTSPHILFDVTREEIMNGSTSVNWKAYQVIKLGCGEPDEVIGYYSNRKKAEIQMLTYAANLGRGCCPHEKYEIKEITIES
jgi:hypothetical protein